MAYLYHPIVPFKVSVPQYLLFRNDPKQSGCEVGQVIGIFSYKGHVPSFKVLLNNGAVWDFCLPNYVSHHVLPTNTEEQFQLADLAYLNCPSCNFAVYIEPKLGEKPVDVYFKHSQRWSYGAEYILTVDWWTKNASVNLVKLANGQMAFVPNHKMLCREGRLDSKLPTELPKYRAFQDEGKLHV